MSRCEEDVLGLLDLLGFLRIVVHSKQSRGTNIVRTFCWCLSINGGVARCLISQLARCCSLLLLSYCGIVVFLSCRGPV